MQDKNNSQLHSARADVTGLGKRGICSMHFDATASNVIVVSARG
jgi:hypothetical protein